MATDSGFTRVAQELKYFIELRKEEALEYFKYDKDNSRNKIHIL